jgi:hypothetical protein
MNVPYRKQLLLPCEYVPAVRGRERDLQEFRLGQQVKQFPLTHRHESAAEVQ